MSQRDSIIKFLTADGMSLKDYFLRELDTGVYVVEFSKNGFHGHAILEDDRQYKEMIKILIENGNKIIPLKKKRGKKSK